jgi:hypothetical protein
MNLRSGYALSHGVVITLSPCLLVISSLCARNSHRLQVSRLDLLSILGPSAFSVSMRLRVSFLSLRFLASGAYLRNLLLSLWLRPSCPLKPASSPVHPHMHIARLSTKASPHLLVSQCFTKPPGKVPPKARRTEDNQRTA